MDNNLLKLAVVVDIILDSDLPYFGKNTTNKNLKEYLYRSDHKYDYLITISHNDKKIPYKGSAIFIHLTDNYRPTSGCIALKRKDFEIILKLIKKTWLK